MQVPSSISNALKKSPFDNNYFHMHEDMRRSLDMVAAGKDTYSSYHYSMLINDLEICLKGFLQAKKDSGEWTEPHANYLTEDHKLFKLIEQVQKFVPLFSYTAEREWQELRRFTAILGREYTLARYSRIVPLEDFLQLDRDFVKPLMEKVYDALKEKSEELLKEEEFSLGL